MVLPPLYGSATLHTSFPDGEIVASFVLFGFFGAMNVKNVLRSSCLQSGSVDCTSKVVFRAFGKFLFCWLGWRQTQEVLKLNSYGLTYFMSHLPHPTPGAECTVPTEYPPPSSHPRCWVYRRCWVPRVKQTQGCHGWETPSSLYGCLYSLRAPPFPVPSLSAHSILKEWKSIWTELSDACICLPATSVQFNKDQVPTKHQALFQGMESAQNR